MQGHKYVYTLCTQKYPSGIGKESAFLSNAPPPNVQNSISLRSSQASTTCPLVTEACTLRWVRRFDWCWKGNRSTGQKQVSVPPSHQKSHMDSPEPPRVKKVQQFSIPRSRFPNEHCFWGVSRLRPSVLIRATWILRKITSTGGMILTVENRCVRWKTYYSATSSTTNLTWTDLRLTPGLCGDMPASNRLSHSTAISAVRGTEDLVRTFHKTVLNTNLFVSFS